MERLRKEHIEALREIKRLQVRETGINHFQFQAYLQSVKYVSFCFCLISASSSNSSGRLWIAQCCPLLTTVRLNPEEWVYFSLTEKKKRKEKGEKNWDNMTTFPRWTVPSLPHSHSPAGMWPGSRRRQVVTPFVGGAMKPATLELIKESADFSSYLSPSSHVPSSGGSIVSSYWAPLCTCTWCSAEGLWGELPVHVPACSMLYLQ